MHLSDIAVLIGQITVLVTAIVPIVVWIKRIIEGQKCQLRSEMLRIYYHNKETGKIRQYEYENFLLLYHAYKALNGNSFIDKIHDEVRLWEVET